MLEVPATSPVEVDYFPIILIRGFDAIGESVPNPFYGFNDGTVYPRGVLGNRIFEGFVVSFLKDEFHRYWDTTNLITFGEPRPARPDCGHDFDMSCFSCAPDARQQLEQMLRSNYYSIVGGESLTASQQSRFDVWQGQQLRRTFWLFRYYDAFPGNIAKRIGAQTIPYFARELQRFIYVVMRLTGAERVNILCHSMGGIITRHFLQRRYDQTVNANHVHRVVSLGTPHGGIRYLSNDFISGIAAATGTAELEAMDPHELQRPALLVGPDAKGPILRLPAFLAVWRWFYGLQRTIASLPEDFPEYKTVAQNLNPPGKMPQLSFSLRMLMLLFHTNSFGLSGQTLLDHKGELALNPRRWLCVVGTRFQDYRWNFGAMGEEMRSSRSDGLVAQDDAVLDGSPRAYLHKIHGGRDSLITSREAFQVATRFLFGTHWVQLILNAASVPNFNAKRQYFLGCSVKPRGSDSFLSRADDISQNTRTLFRPGEPERLDSGEASVYLLQECAGAKGTASLRAPVQLFGGALDLSRSRGSEGISGRPETIVFRVDLVLYAQDDLQPVGEESEQDEEQLAKDFTTLIQSDIKLLSEQIIVSVNKTTNELKWIVVSQTSQSANSRGIAPSNSAPGGTRQWGGENGPLVVATDAFKGNFTIMTFGLDKWIETKGPSYADTEENSAPGGWRRRLA